MVLMVRLSTSPFFVLREWFVLAGALLYVRSMSFPNDTFDVVLSNLCIHNIPTALVSRNISPHYATKRAASLIIKVLELS
jgi:hypothetical protein